MKRDNGLQAVGRNRLALPGYTAAGILNLPAGFWRTVWRASARSAVLGIGSVFYLSGGLLPAAAAVLLPLRLYQGSGR